MINLQELGRHDDEVFWAADERPGRVVIVHGPTAEVLWYPDDYPVSALVELRHALDVTPVAGDWVALHEGQIARIEHRSTALTRPDPDGQSTQTLAANIDLVLIVLPIDHGLNVKALERLSVMAWDSGAQQTIALTKADATASPEEALEQALLAAPGVDVVLTSSMDGTGLDDLRARLGTGVTATMLGASGAGKTTLLNALDGRSEFTREVRRDGEGRHSTTTRRLYRLQSGGVLLDLPGIRSLDLSASEEAVAEVFADITALARFCHFADCHHDSEPGCAVRKAIAAGELDERRLTSWLAIGRAQGYQERRHDPAKAAEQRKEWKKATMASKRGRGRYA